MSDSNASLVTVVKNTSGVTKRFGFLPPHGMQLTANETVSVFGHLTEAVNRGDRFGKRHMTALQAALLNDDINIQSTPGVVLLDATTGDPRTLTLSANVLDIANPSWDSLSESIAGNPNS